MRHKEKEKVGLSRRLGAAVVVAMTSLFGSPEAQEAARIVHSEDVEPSGDLETELEERGLVLREDREDLPGS